MRGSTSTVRGFLKRPQGQPCHSKELKQGTCLVVQWLRLHTPNAGAWGSIPGQGTRSHMWQLRPAAAAAKSLQLCPTLCDPTDSSPPGSPVPSVAKKKKKELKEFLSKILGGYFRRNQLVNFWSDLAHLLTLPNKWQERLVPVLYDTGLKCEGWISALGDYNPIFKSPSNTPWILPCIQLYAWTLASYWALH